MGMTLEEVMPFTSTTSTTLFAFESGFFVRDTQRRISAYSLADTRHCFFRLLFLLFVFCFTLVFGLPRALFCSPRIELALMSLRRLAAAYEMGIAMGFLGLFCF
jgi:hypothetical protein